MSTFVAALVVAFSASAYAQQTLPAPTDPRAEAIASLSGKIYGTIDFGGHFSSIDGDEARYQRYRDLRDGPLANNFLFNRRGETWTFNATANKIGYRDQQYTGEYRLVGKVKARFDWNEIPTFISSDTRTLYIETSPGVFRLPDSLRAANQANLTTLRDYEVQAASLDVRNTRKTGAFDFVYMANEAVDVKFNVTSGLRTGAMPYGAPFGFNNLIEIAAPIDQRTTDARASVEWANRKGMLSVGWDAQWFDNAVETLIWDNPLKLTDSPPYSSAYQDGRAAATGRMAFWPDNNTQYIHGTASYATPLRGRVTGYVAIGQASQNETLLPHTSNTLIPEIPLERPTAEAELRNTVVHLQYTARPVTMVSFNAKYRYMDMDNRTPEFDPGGRVRFDGVYDATDYPSPEFYSIKRQNFDVDGSVRPFKYTALKVGYGYAEVDRTFRIWEVTKEGTFRVSADTTGNPYVTFRALFENARREGEGFDPHNILEHVGEQPGMRHYDVADRDRKRFTVLTTLTPVSIFSVTLSAGVGREEYPDTEFGFQEFDSDQYSIGFDLVPSDRIGLTMAYAWETYASVTASRSANPPSATDQGFYDPRRNWWMDYDGKVKNFDAALDIAEIAPKTDVRFGFSWNDVTDIYNYRLAPDSVLPQVTQAGWQLTPVTNELLRGTFDLNYKLSSKIHVGGAYWYERYRVDDFALGEAYTSAVVLPLAPEGGAPATPTTLLLGYAYRPYTANTGMVRLTYLW